jgi:hypothetical protein
MPRLIADYLFLAAVFVPPIVLLGAGLIVLTARRASH